MINTFRKKEILWFHVFSKMKIISKTITNKWLMLIKQFVFYISSTLSSFSLVHSIHFLIYKSFALSVIIDQYIITHWKLYISMDYLDFVIIEFEIWFSYQRRNCRSVLLWSVHSELKQFTFTFDDCSSSAHKLSDSTETQVIGTITVLKSF
jgi:hypothetical protein